VLGVGCWVLGVRLTVQDIRFRDGSGLKAQCSMLKVQGLGLKIWSLEFGVENLGLTAPGLKVEG